MAKANLQTFYDFRAAKLALLEEKKIDNETFMTAIHGFLVKNKIKPSLKPKNRNAVLTNYFYWVTYIERKIILESKLIVLGLGSEDQLKEVIKIYSKRRDKLVHLLLTHLKEKPKNVSEVDQNLLKITLQDDKIVYCSKKILEELNFSQKIQSEKLTSWIYYENFLKFS